MAIIGHFKVDDPMDPTVAVGPVINKAAVDRILGMFERAKADGAAKFELGGGRCGGELADGTFIEPTLIVDADPAPEHSQVAIFGPPVVVMNFNREDGDVPDPPNPQHTPST